MHEPMIAFSCDDLSPKTRVTKLKELLRTADRFDMNVSLFVIPTGKAKWDSCSSLVGVLKDAQSRGHEIGLHGLSHSVFETGNLFHDFGFGYAPLKDKILRGLTILDEKLGVTPKGFRAPYHHCSQNLWRVLDDLNFLYDSSKISLSSALLSYVPPLRTIYVSRKRGLSGSTMFHPLNLRLWEIPIAQEFTWYNLKLEVGLFRAFFRNCFSKIEASCLVINSHIGALSMWGFRILKEMFLCMEEKGLRELTLAEMAERTADLEAAKACCV